MFSDFGKFITQNIPFKSHKTLCPQLKRYLNKNSKPYGNYSKNNLKIAEFALNLYFTIFEDYAYSGVR